VVEKYIDYMFYNFFRNDFQKMASKGQINPEGNTQEDWAETFFAPAGTARERSAILKSGLPLPLICFWRSDVFHIKDGFYGHSVLKRLFQWKRSEADGSVKELSAGGRWVTFKTSYSIVADSYYMNFINKFNNDVLELDMQRYIDFAFTGYIDSFHYFIEFELKNHKTENKVDESGDIRAFTSTAEWDVSWQMPMIRGGHMLESISMWLEKQKIMTIRLKKPDAPDPNDFGS
jgi:hypothetical protein